MMLSKKILRSQEGVFTLLFSSFYNVYAWSCYISLTGAMFPIPRVVYAMANDGLLFRSLARVHARSQTPVLATLLAGLLGGLLLIPDMVHSLLLYRQNS
jgi:amino acid transporter